MSQLNDAVGGGHGWDYSQVSDFSLEMHGLESHLGTSDLELNLAMFKFVILLIKAVYV